MSPKKRAVGASPRETAVDYPVDDALWSGRALALVVFRKVVV